jgi:hypothetical protein
MLDHQDRRLQAHHERRCIPTMQLHKTMRIAGVSLSAAALALLTAEGTAAAHERTSGPDLRGRVTSVASGDFVLQKYDGTTETVDTTSGTSYSEPGTSVAPPGVLQGENVVVTLDPTAPSPTATSVLVFPERVSGRVTNVAGSTITLSTRRGSDTVLVSPGTKYFQKGASPTGVTAGEQVSAFGLPDASAPGDLDAQVVAIFSPASWPHPHPHPQPPTPTTQPAPAPQPQPQPQQPTTDAVTSGQHGAPQLQPAAPQPDGTPGWGHSAPNGASPPHGPSGGPGPAGGPGPRGGQGALGGHR